MPYATTDDGVRLYYEETGSGRPVIFVHEFAGDLRSWEPQMRHFGKRYRAVAYNARGFPPSDVPEQPSSYSQARAADDILAVLEAEGPRWGARAGRLGLYPARRTHTANERTVRNLCTYQCQPSQLDHQKHQGSCPSETRRGWSDRR